MEVLPQQSKNTRQRQSPLITVLSLSASHCLSQTHTCMRGMLTLHSLCTCMLLVTPQYLGGKRSKLALSPYRALMIWPLDNSPAFSSTTYLHWPCPASHSKKKKRIQSTVNTLLCIFLHLMYYEKFPIISSLIKPDMSTQMGFPGSSVSKESVAQSVKNPPAMEEIQVQFLGREDPMEKG